MPIVSVETAQMVYHMCFVYNVVSRNARNGCQMLVHLFDSFCDCSLCSSLLRIVGHFFLFACLASLVRVFRLHKPEQSAAKCQVQ